MVRQLGLVLPAVLTVVLLGMVAAQADDLNQPIWRGAPGSTVQEWDFLTAGIPITDPQPGALYDPPDGMDVPYDNPYGGASARYYPGSGQEWQPMWEGREGVLPLSGTIVLDIWNVPLPNPVKDIRLQITWRDQTIGGQHPEITMPEIFGPGSDPFDWGLYAEETIALPGIGDWQHTTIDLKIWPNPEFESIRIDGAIDVDQIVVDTICIPEPASLALIGFGALALAMRRRR